MSLRRISLLVAVTLVFAACGDTADAPVSAPLAAPTTTVTTFASTTSTMAATTVAPSSTVGAGQEGTTPPTSSAEVASPVLRMALAQTTAAASGRMEGSIIVAGIEGAPGLEELSMPFSGAWDTDAGFFAFTMDLSGIAAAAGAEIPDMIKALMGEMEVRQIGDTAYLRFPLINSMFGVETEWLAMPADDSAGAVSGFAAASPGNPADLLSALEDAHARVIETGREVVRGVNTTRLTVTFDIERLLETATAAEREKLAAQGSLPMDELPMDIWIGDDGLVYRYQIEIDGTDIGVTDGQGFDRMAMMFEMWDWGEAIDVAPPPADQITSAEDLALFDPNAFGT